MPSDSPRSSLVQGGLLYGWNRRQECTGTPEWRQYRCFGHYGLCNAHDRALNCGGMHQVYSQQRPGRPRWALASSAALLLMTTLLAVGLIQHKDNAGDVALAPFPATGASSAAPGVEGQLPTGWQVGRTADDAPPGTILVATEPARNDLPGRQLFVYVSMPSALGLPFTAARETADRIARSLAPGGSNGIGAIGPDLIGGFPGVTVERTGLYSPRVRLYCISRAALAPGGQIIGVALRSIQPLRGGDRRLLDKISAHLAFSGIRVVPDGQELMKAAGIEFSPPDDSRFVDDAPGFPRIRMMGGSGEEAWFIDVCRLRLGPDRAPQQVVEDHLLTILRQAGLPTEVEIHQSDGREVAATMASVGEQDSTVVAAAGTRTDGETGLLVSGRCGSAMRDRISEWCRSLAAEAKTVAFPGGLDLDAAREHASRLLGRLAGEGFGEPWLRQAGAQLRYTVFVPGMTVGRLHNELERERVDAGTWWRTRESLALAERRRAAQVASAETWLVEDGGSGLEHQYVQLDASGRPEITLEERRENGENVIRRTLKVLHGGIRQGTLPIGERFVSEPVLVYLASHLARDPARSAAEFTATEMFARQPVHWLVVPLGEVELPPGGSQRTGWAVRIHRDIAVEPITLFYDDGGSLIARDIDRVVWNRLDVEAGEASDLR